MNAAQLDTRDVIALACLMLIGHQHVAGRAAGDLCHGDVGRVFLLCWAIAAWNEAGQRTHGIVAWERTLYRALGNTEATR